MISASTLDMQIVDERDKSEKLWELLKKLHEHPPSANHDKTVRRVVDFEFCALWIASRTQRRVP